MITALTMAAIFFWLRKRVNYKRYAQFFEPSGFAARNKKQ